MAQRYESIRELDEEKNGGEREKEMSIERYMIPPPFWKLGASIEKYEKAEEEKERYLMAVSQPMTANKTTHIRVKDINNGDLIEFPKMVEVARFLGTHVSYMRKGIGYGSAMVYLVGEKEYVIEYNGKERPSRVGFWQHKEGKKITAFHKNGWSKEFCSYFDVARYFGLLVGEVIEDSKRIKSRIHVINNEEFTLEFEGVKREIATSWKVVCTKWGIYDRNYEGIEGIKVTQGNPQPSEEVVWYDNRAA